jgi:hypothetical protein
LLDGEVEDRLHVAEGALREQQLDRSAATHFFAFLSRLRKSPSKNAVRP